MTDTAKGLPGSKDKPFQNIWIEDSFVDGLESTKKLLKVRSTLKET